MNKKILAVAVSAAMFAAASVAVAGDAEVYGLVHLSIDSVDDGGTGAAKEDGLFMMSNSSRLGVKGAEDLGNGMKAMFQFEGAVVVSDADDFGFMRNTFAGLSGGFGSVLAGRHDTPFKSLGRSVDMFGDQLGDSRNLTRGASQRSAERLNNVVVYSSPDMNGLKASVAYMVDDGVDDADSYSVGVNYKAGPLMVGAAYESHGEAFADGDLTDVTAATDEASTLTALAASYNAGAITVAAYYQTVSDVNAVDGEDATAMGLGASYKAGDAKFKAQYYTVDVDRNSAADQDDAATLMAIGVDFAMSKRTTAYAQYASISNDDTANFAFNASGGHASNGMTQVNGDDTSGFSLGLIHKF